MAQVTETVARGILAGHGYTDNEVRQLAHHWLASHGQAPAQAAPAAVAGPIGYGPKVTVRRSCSDCKACNSESYAVQGDSGHYVYCEHPSLPESKYIGDTNWNTPHWCPVSAPTTQPAPQQEAQEPAGWFDDDRVFWHEGKQPAQGSDLYTTPQPSPAAQHTTTETTPLAPTDDEIDALIVYFGPTSGLREDSRDLTIKKLRELVRTAIAKWGAQQVPASAAEFALQALVAAGHVSQELVDRALALPGAPQPAHSGESVGYLYCGGSYGDELADWEIVAEQLQCDRLNEHHGALGKEAKLPLYTAPRPVEREPLTPREIELIDGMIDVQLDHAMRCDAIANRAMADKQKGWDMERVALLQKFKAAHGIKGGGDGKN